MRDPGWAGARGSRCFGGSRTRTSDHLLLLRLRRRRHEGPCGERGLVDAGDGSREEILAYLDRAGSRSLRWVSPSHYDADHLGDVVDVATAPGASVGAVYDRGGDRNAKDTDT
ncbi:MAG: MBL fold metallo-hydrolase [Actinobacteria bacterium]|nr:MBL fold metallo-hydrolase [Actinomycetota bacterium]